jgi:glycerophosphoryl diester phosphodiesterase
MLDLGVDGLVTDRPDIAADLLKERGIRWSAPR